MRQPSTKCLIRKDKKVKHISLKSLRDKAWALQSKWIRQSEKGFCFTCGDHRRWQEQQAGHYIHGNAMDFVPLNIHCQCVRCNKWLSGNGTIYAERMVTEYGLDAVLELRRIAEERKAKTYKYTIFELEKLIEDLQTKIEGME